MRSTINQAKGNFDGPEIAMTILANDQMMTLDDYREQVVVYRNRGPVRVKDIAEVTEEPENRRQASMLDDQPAVILAIHRQPGANTLKVVDSIKAILPELEAGLPGDIDIHEIADRTLTTRASILNVEHELLTTIALVVMVIYLFLRNIPATLIPSLSVPLSLAGTFAAMYALGYSLNNLTLMALTIATGFVVDDAIVMLENIMRYIEKGMPPRKAAIQGAGEIGFTILSLTASLIAVLIPLLFMGDVLGRLFREFAMTLTLAILVSALVSLTLTPMLAAFLPRTQHAGSHQEPWLLMRQIQAFYETSLHYALDRSQKVILLAMGLLVLTFGLMFIVPKGFFPVQDVGMLVGITEADPSIGFESMQEHQTQLAERILKDPAVESLTSHVGIDGTNATLNNGRFLITLKPYEERVPAHRVIDRLKAELNDIEGIRLHLQPVQDLTIEDRVSQAQYQFTIERRTPDSSIRGTPRFSRNSHPFRRSRKSRVILPCVRERSSSKSTGTPPPASGSRWRPLPRRSTMPSVNDRSLPDTVKSISTGSFWKLKGDSSRTQKASGTSTSQLRTVARFHSPGFCTKWRPPAVP